MCHCTDEETEAPRNEGTCPRSLSWEGAGRVIVATSVWLFQPYLMALQTESQTCPFSSSDRGPWSLSFLGCGAEPLARYPSWPPRKHLSPGAQVAGSYPGQGQRKAMHRPLLATCPFAPAPAQVAFHSRCHPVPTGLSVPSQGPLTAHPRGKCLFRSLSALLLASGGYG